MFMPTTVSDDAQEVIGQLPDEDRRKLVHDCVSAIIILGQNRAPIKKVELNKHLQRTARVHQAILNVASYELNKYFGFRLYELEDKARLLLVNSSVEFSKYANHSKSMCEELTILYFILMDIFASADEKLSENEIENSLSPLELTTDVLKSHIDFLVKKLYLKVVTEQFQSDKKLYKWGPRAYAEIDPDSFLESFLNLAGEGSIDDWPEQKKRIEKMKSIPNR